MLNPIAIDQEAVMDSYENACQPNYERECHRLQKQVCKLSQENEGLKTAVVELVLRFVVV